MNKSNFAKKEEDSNNIILEEIDLESVERNEGKVIITETDKLNIENFTSKLSKRV